MDVTIVIPQRGKDHLTEALLASLNAYDSQFGNCEIVIINDHPGLDVSPCVRELADLVVESRGAGWTAAVNMGIDHAKGEKIVLLNNDVVCTGDALAYLTSSLDMADMAGVATRYDQDADMLVFEGWCLAFRKSDWERVGKFDDAMKLYFADTDFQMRFLESNPRMATALGTKLVHVGHQTAHDPEAFPNRRQQWAADRKAFLEKRQLIRN